MARVLIASKVADLSEADITRTLFKAGFGRHSIKALHRRAARMARSFKTEKGRGAEE